ncbi:MAG: ATP synthase F0 subunit B [Hydrogenothermaceae bacterium]|nr:ATP synthase F0 subunit B [Hydrogenothermaceae bacterium]
MHVGIALDQTLIFQLILFLIFMAVMKKIYFDPYLQAFSEREETIRKLYEEAKANNLKSSEILKEVEEILSRVREESKIILDESARKVNAEVAEIIRKASEDAEIQIQKVKEDIDRVVEIEMKIIDETVNKIAQEVVKKLTLQEAA